MVSSELTQAYRGKNKGTLKYQFDPASPTSIQDVEKGMGEVRVILVGLEGVSPPIQ